MSIKLEAPPEVRRLIRPARGLFDATPAERREALDPMRRDWEKQAAEALRVQDWKALARIAEALDCLGRSYTD